MVLAIGLMAFSYKAVELDGIIKALAEGNAQQLSQHFDESVDIKLPGKEDLKQADNKVAESVLAAFFKQSRVRNFEVTSKREMTGTMYLAGKLYCDVKDYNVTLMIKNKGDKPRIITIRIN